MTLAVPVGPPTVTINRDDRVVVCQPDGRIEAAEQEGFFPYLRVGLPLALFTSMLGTLWLLWIHGVAW